MTHHEATLGEPVLPREVRHTALAALGECCALRLPDSLSTRVDGLAYPAPDGRPRRSPRPLPALRPPLSGDKGGCLGPSLMIQSP
jgi:hypothetical protein